MTTGSLFDPYLFSQTGVDSGVLTMLGVVVHSFGEPGEYRGTVHREEAPEATFTISVDKAAAVAQATIDLARLTNPHPSGCDCGADHGAHFVVHPRGFAVFHVSGGRGGYWATVRRADEDPDVVAYDTRRLEPGDTFSAMLLRPGSYSLRNDLSDAYGEIVVPYPTVGDKPFRPPPPADVECGGAFEPRELRLHPTQGLNIRIVEPARVRIELVEPDEGPGRPSRRRAGWKKRALQQLE
jgi:hypothetical protein